MSTQQKQTMFYSDDVKMKEMVNFDRILQRIFSLGEEPKTRREV